MSDIQFFGEIDRQPDGTIRSSLPAWYYQEQIFQLNDMVEEIEMRLKNGTVPRESVPYEQERLKTAKSKLEKIIKDRPTLSGPQKDKVKKLYDELAESIKSSMFCEDDMRSGKASGFEEYRRGHRPCIKVPDEAIEMCGLKHEKKMVSRNEATRAFKIFGRILGENTNVEELRAPSRH